MDRKQLFVEALTVTKEKYKSNPDYFILQAIISQLEYLVNIINGSENDLSKLKSIIIGRMTAHDIDTWDPRLAEILYSVSEEVKKMNLEYGL
ncbi:MAG: immunity protein Tsi6 family protein [Coxiellaceae bacterium]|nr:immunity protein Tsi6 family protein [Coxiellaceae bacterium]